MIKNLISRILISNKKNKKIVTIKNKKFYKNILDILWNEGFIYGYQIKLYKKFYFVYKIFIKFNQKNYYPLKKLNFFNNICSYNILLNLNKIEKNYLFFLINDKGFFSHKNSLVLGFGGKIFLKV